MDIDKTTRIRTFRSGRGNVKLMSEYLGTYTGAGKTWECFGPVGLRMSVWVRTELTTTGKATHIYDPAASFRAKIVKN